MNERTLRAAGPGILVVAAIVAMIAALIYGGGADVPELIDTGPVVRWGIPAAKLLVNLSFAGVIGPLVLALFALKPEQRAFGIALDIVSISSALLTISAATTAFLTFLDIYNVQVTFDDQFGAQLGEFLVTTEFGAAWLIICVGSAMLTVIAFAVRGWLVTLVIAVLAIALLYPLSSTGHSGSQANHNLAVSSIFLHVLGAAVWIGGLILLIFIRPVVKKGLVTVLWRYSTLALASFVVVAGSGLVRSVIGVETLEGMFSQYGVLVIAKTLTLVALGIFGALYRRRLIARLTHEGRRGIFWLLIAYEFLVMGLASGIAVGLGRTPPPADETLEYNTSPAQTLTGSELPPELTPVQYITQWDLDILWIYAVLFAAFFYWMGVRRLRQRGDSWPVHRSVFWYAGLLVLFWVTSGSINAYQDYLFSVHMFGHMMLAMAIPLLLVLGAPITLVLRSVHKRSDGTRGVREWVLWFVHSPASKVLTHPFVAGGIYAISLWIFYFTDLFRWTLYDHLGHQWMIVHFILSGYLFVLSIIGADPVPYRLPYAGRLILLIGVAAMHAFFGVVIMSYQGLFVAEWYGALGRTWGATPLEDQAIGGGIAWSVGELPTLILAITIAIQWSKSDKRMQVRNDRNADRTGEAELAEYNAKLAELAAKEPR